MELFFHFMFAFAIYPVKKLYWTRVHFPRIKGNWIDYIFLTVGWSLIFLWFYLGARMSDLYAEQHTSSSVEVLVGVYILIWFAIVVGMAVYAWIKAEDELKYQYRKNKLPQFMQDFLDNAERESKTLKKRRKH